MGPHPRTDPLLPLLPPAAAPPPLLYSSWLIIQASRRGGVCILPLPHPLPAVLFTLPRGTGQILQPPSLPSEPEQGADKALSFSLSASPCQPANPRGPNMDPHKHLTPPPNLSPFFFLLLLLLSSITLKTSIVH